MLPDKNKDLLAGSSVLLYDRMVIAAKARCEGFDLAMDAVEDVAIEAFKKGDDELARQYRDTIRMMRISRQRMELGEALKRANRQRDEIHDTSN